MNEWEKSSEVVMGAAAFRSVWWSRVVRVLTHLLSFWEKSTPVAHVVELSGGLHSASTWAKWAHFVVLRTQPPLLLPAELAFCGLTSPLVLPCRSKNTFRECVIWEGNMHIGDCLGPPYHMANITAQTRRRCYFFYFLTKRVNENTK